MNGEVRLWRSPKDFWLKFSQPSQPNEPYIALPAAESEAERLRDVLRQTHANYCDSAWTDRGLHAPECLIEHLDDDEPSRPEGEVRDGR